MEIWVTIASSVATMATTIGALTYILSSQIAGLRREVDARFDAIDHRFTALESDMTLVKAHLLNVKT